MRLPKNLLSDSYVSPRLYLCQTNKERIGELNINNLKGTFKWNTYSEISFDIDRQYCDIVSGDTIVNPYYDKVEGLRLVLVEGFGYFQLQDPEDESDGIKETKSINAYSSEYDLSNRYLETFIINKGVTGSIDGVILYNPNDTEHSLLHLVIAEKAPDWHIGHVDADLATEKRFFEVDRESVYDFLMNDVCETFKCVIIFDTYDNSINVYKEETAGTDTDVIISFSNLINNINVSYVTDDIKTVLTVKGADDLSIREINYGLAHITDLSYYHTVDWMGQDLYDAYNNYLQVLSIYDEEYNAALANIRKYNLEISELKNRAKQELTDAKIDDFIDFLIDFYKNEKADDEKISDLNVDFVYLDKDAWNNFITTIKSTATMSQKEDAIEKILDIIWDGYGLDNLQILASSYKGVQVVQTDADMSNPDNADYYQYHANYTMLTTVQKDMAERESAIATAKQNLQNNYDIVNRISQQVSIPNNFTTEQIIRLAPFLREDEYVDDNFVVTDIDTEEDRLETLNALLKTGYEELHKLSQPKLSFKTSIANVFALNEFEPIINQFQLGNMIRIALRDNYIKKSRLMEIEIEFHDLKNFQVTFGDLLSVRDEADIHADLLSKAINAGKSVTKNASAWQKGSNVANEIQQNINQGLLDAATEIKSIDALQEVSLDKYGLHLRKKSGNGEYDPKQGWLVSNKILYTDDNWKTTKSVFGEYKYKGEDQWGVLANAVVAGYIEGSEIEGGEIRIGKNPDTGDYTFIVTSDGRVQINAWGGELSEKIDEINDKVNEYTISIESSTVPVFDENVRSTILVCNIIQNGKTVIAPSGTTYTWIRSSNNTDADKEWNSDTSHRNNTSNILVIDAGDVDNSARFTCEVYIP